MKNTLLAFAFSASAILPASATAEIAGLHLPTGLNPLNALSAFVASLLLLTALADYTRTVDSLQRSRRNPATPTPKPLDSGKSVHPLAA